MDRRKFFSLLGAGVAGIALEQAIPLGRVWSFPSKIVVPKPVVPLTIMGEYAASHFRVGDTIRIAMPQRFIVRELVDLRPPVSRYENFVVTESNGLVIGLEPIP